MSDYTVAQLKEAPDVMGDYPGEMRFLTPVLDPTMVALPRPVAAANRMLRAYWGVIRKAL